MNDSFETSPILPVGKLPMDLLGDLLGGYEIDDDRVVVGPGVGRDAAVLDFGTSNLVVKSDPITFATDDSALYLVSVNANDLACLGATPRWLMVTALLPEGQTTASMVKSLFSDLVAVCERHAISLIGGHTEITSGLDRVILVGTMLGEAQPAGLLQPGGGRPGDRLVVTSPIVVEGTALLAREFRRELSTWFDEPFLERAANLLIDPGISIVDHATALLQTGGVTALHDPTEGGLASGLREIAVASGCGVVINRELIPVRSDTEQICAHLDIDPLGLLASGSLLAAVSPEKVPEVLELGMPGGGRPVVIGKLTSPERGFTMVNGGETQPLPAFATDEFARILASRV